MMAPRTARFAAGKFPPGPRRGFPGVSFVKFRRDPIAFLRSVARDYGDITSFQVGPQRLTLLNHPDLIRDVLITHAAQFHKGRGLERAKRLLGEGLLTSEGELHQRQRRLILPAFHRQRLQSYARTMVECAERFELDSDISQPVDISRHMMRLTLQIVCKTLFNADVRDQTLEINDAVTEVIALFRILMLPYADLLESLPLPAVRRFRSARSRLDGLIYKMIREHRDSVCDQGDLLSMLLDAQDEENGGMSEVQVRDEAMTLLLAGHETTANALTWTWYLLSQNPRAEAAFHAEIDACLTGRSATFDDLPSLPYTRAVLAESMRLYPPAWIISRKTMSDYEVAGYTLPTSSVVLMCQAVTHRDARWFPEPDVFNPRRWIDGDQSLRPKFAYFPFGGGPRTCIGEQFAWAEAILLLATIGQRWKMALAPNHRIACQPIITLRPRYGMRMLVEKRGRT